MNLLATDFSNFFLHNLFTLFFDFFFKKTWSHLSAKCVLSKSSHNTKLHGMDHKKLVCDESFECLFLQSDIVFETYLYEWNIKCQKYLRQFKNLMINWNFSCQMSNNVELNNEYFLCCLLSNYLTIISQNVYLNFFILSVWVILPEH